MVRKTSDAKFQEEIRGFMTFIRKEMKETRQKLQAVIQINGGQPPANKSRKPTKTVRTRSKPAATEARPQQKTKSRATVPRNMKVAARKFQKDLKLQLKAPLKNNVSGLGKLPKATFNTMVRRAAMLKVFNKRITPTALATEKKFRKSAKYISVIAKKVSAIYRMT